LTRPAPHVARFNRSAVAIAAASFLATTAVIGALGGMAPAQAQVLINHDSSAPVDFAADSIEVQSRADRVVIAGGVVVRQAGLTITAARMTVAYTDTNAVDVNRIDAVGGVTVTKGADRASGNAAIYDLDRRIITMIGNVRLNQGANALNGDRLVIDLGSGRASVNARGAPGVPGTTSGSGGRVTGRFTVPNRGGN
jgi:lipopolysaccharide export system protein LptA